MTYIPSADDLEVITREVWTSFLDGDPSGLIAETGDMPADKITGCVYLSGAYTGSIMLQCSPPPRATPQRRCTPWLQRP